jgi:serine/threonine protein kinase
MSLTVQNVFGLLLRSKLLAADDAKSIYERWRKEAKDLADDLEKFRRWLVGHHYLTDYQAGLLCKGHTEGYFINDYKILDRLGRGRMAGVYKGVHTLGQVVAIKVLPPSKAKDAYLLSRFHREAKLALQLKHHNAVRAYQLGESQGLHYIVMEYLEGETLEEVLNRRKRLPPAEAVRITYQALLGLQHIHDKGMVHRDIKPSNLMLVPARVPGQPDTTVHATLKILDIGLGRMFFDENVPAEALAEEPQLTGDGVLLGTPDYLAPEQARNARGVDIRADIYSMGCVLYHCLSGHPPFPDTNIINQMMRHAQEQPKPLKEINPEVPDGLQQIVNWMMAKNPDQRYPTPDRAAQAMQVFLTAGADAPKAAEPDASMSQYLMWLENGEGGIAAAPAARPASPRAPVPVPVARPAAPPPAPRPAVPVTPPVRATPAPPAAAPAQAIAMAAPPAARPAAPPAAPAAAAPVAASPVAQPGIPLPGKPLKKQKSGKSSKGSRTGRSRHGKSHAGRRVKKKHRVARPAGPPPGLEGDFDVELVPMGGGDKPATALKPARSGGLSRRELFLLLGGGAGVLIAIVLGAALASGGFGPLMQKFSGAPAVSAPEDTSSKPTP